jgi:uncharacterized protein
MPVVPPISYPGVYVQEIPSGVRTITGVPTSITAFMGRAPRGPVNEPTAVFNYGDYERVFGGLDLNSTMSYAVRDFFNNGGGQALIVRLFHSDEIAEAKTAVDKAQSELADKSEDNALKKALEEAKTKLQEAQTTADGYAKQKVEGGNKPFLQAVSPGTWANGLFIQVDRTGIDDSVLQKFGYQKANPLPLFNLKIYDRNPNDENQTLPPPRPIESIPNVSVSEGKRRLDRVLAQESGILRAVEGQLPTTAPADNVMYELVGGADSDPLTINAYTGSEADKTGLYALEKADLFNLLSVPPDSRDGDLDPSLHSTLAAYCVKRRAMYVVDPPHAWAARKETAAATAKASLGDLGVSGPDARNAALYFPRVTQADPLREGQPDVFPACGIVAGVIARTDATRGVWKAPAGQDAALNGIRGLQANLTDAENGLLNPLGVNCLRIFPTVGPVIWGARTLRGADQLADEYKYVPVRRLALFIEETLYRSTHWAVFEPNDEPLWAQLRLNIGVFMHDLFRQGAFQGGKPGDAYFVRCDATTTTQSDIDKGIVNIIVGFAPLKPAEFVIIYLQQMAGNLAA